MTNSNSERVQGTVKFFNPAKGFGFIKQDNGDKDVFIHGNQLTEGVVLSPNQRVEFEIEDRPKGPSAKNLRAL